LLTTSNLGLNPDVSYTVRVQKVAHSQTFLALFSLGLSLFQKLQPNRHISILWPW